MSNTIVIEDNTCEKCRKKFSTKSNLVSHKKNSKNCKDLNTNNDKHVCTYCTKELATISTLTRHELICPEKEKKEAQEKIKKLEKNLGELHQQINKNNIETQEINKQIQDKYVTEIINKNLVIKELEINIKKYEEKIDDKNKQIEDKDKQIQELQDTIRELASKAIDNKSPLTSNTTTNNIIQGGDLTLYMNKEEIHQKILNNLVKDNVYTGLKGLAEFVKSHIAVDENGKQIYFCVDASRQFFCFKDGQGNEVKDPKATKMIKMIKPSIEERLKKIREDENIEYDRLKNLSIYNEERIEKLPICEFTLDKASKLMFEVYDMTNNNKMASEMVKLLS